MWIPAFAGMTAPQRRALSLQQTLLSSINPAKQSNFSWFWCKRPLRTVRPSQLHAYLKIEECLDETRI
jgi:hypothetical protein